MSQKNPNEVIKKGAILLIGAVDAPANINPGYLPQDETVEVTAERENYELMVQDYAGPVDDDYEYTSIAFDAPLFQVNPETLKFALGLNPTGTRVQIGGDTPTPNVHRSFKILGRRRDGKVVVAAAPAGVVTADILYALTRTEQTKLPFGMKSLDGASRGGYLDVSDGQVNATLATGVLTRDPIIGYHRVFGEGAVADSLVSIAGTSLVDGEFLVLELGTPAQPITLVHLDGTLELEGDIDWVMNAQNDSITLQYTLATDSWAETDRFEAP